MTGDCHVRFCESRGAESPRPLTKKRHHKKQQKKKTTHQKKRGAK
jgi:hypothetical protein